MCMKNNVNKNVFSFVWSVCLVGLFILIFVGYNISKGTNAYFGDPETGSGNLGGEIYSVYYYRNWPNIDEIEPFESKKYNITLIMGYNELFEEIDDYKFIGWNTKADGSGISFDVDTTHTLKENMNLYAQWSLIIAYGDVNEDKLINEDDYLLIEKHLNGEDVLNEQGIINADVNNDGNITLVDVDIVKQVCLGTVGYVGFLPDKPLLIYDIYEGNIDIGTDKPVDDENNNIENEKGNDGDNNSSSNNIGNGTGSGNSGNGNQSTGTGQGGSSSNNGGTSTENNTSDENIDDNNDDTNNEDIDDEVSENTFKFRFMNGNLEYTSSECKINDGECLLVLPKDSPKVEGYKFTGWSEELGCPDNRGILKSVYVNSDKIYYACFVNNKNWKNVYLFIIILIICLTAFRLIWNLISNFKKENNVVDNDI